MKGAQHPKNDVSLNPSGNESILDVIERADPARRRFLRSTLSAGALSAAGGVTLGGFSAAVSADTTCVGTVGGINFDNLPAERITNVVRNTSDAIVSYTPVADAVRVSPGYTAELLIAWGDPIMPGGTAFVGDASETAAQQERQWGTHTDGMHYFGFVGRDGKESSERGLIANNHEYTHEAILHGAAGLAGPMLIEKARKSQACHGVAVFEVRKTAGKWQVVRNSPFGRRLTGNTPMRVSGPAAGHPLMRSKKYAITATGSFDTGVLNTGFECNGTLNNCAHGYTPWGTYLTCEENWNGYFGSRSRTNLSTGASTGTLVSTGTLTQAQFDALSENQQLYRRYGISSIGFNYRWHEVDDRFDVDQNPNEPNLFGWVVEVDPFNPRAVPVKRTALGRFKHESAQYVLGPNNEFAVYMGCDERNEYIYKFVANRPYNPTNRAANRDLLDDGVLYVAKFNAAGAGEWIALLPGTIGVNGQALRNNPLFSGANDAEVLAKILIKTRMAADAVGATMMDRPEWVGVRPKVCGFDEIEVYCTLTNNNRRGTGTASVNQPNGSAAAGQSRPPVDAANPRADNRYGHIVRWRETGKNVTATTFSWDIFVQCGDTATALSPASQYIGDINDTPNGSADYGAPDGLWFDQFGRLWVQTDQQGDGLGDWTNIGANSMVCADPATGVTKRFMTGPIDSEVTGVVTTPDGKSMFVGLQHPGEGAQNPANPTEVSNWPRSQWATNSFGEPIVGGRPRSGIVVITHNGGEVVGAGASS